MINQQRALTSWQQGRYRESANEYWEAFQCLPSLTHEARYHVFHGYTSTLRGDFVQASENDLNNMRKVFEDKHEPRLFRLEAAYTLGVVHYDRSERHKCEDIYHRAIAMGEKKLKKARDEKAEEKKMIIRVADTEQKKTMKELMKGVLEDCRKNLNALNTATKGEIRFRPEDQPTKRTHGMPIGRLGTSLTQDEINSLIDVGGIHCDCCKREDAKLFKCSICNKVRAK